MLMGPLGIGLPEFLMLSVPLAFAIITMKVANERSNLPVLWFFLGLLLGPFALLAAFLTSRKKPCAQCRKRIENDALNCAYCGSTQ